MLGVREKTQAGQGGWHGCWEDRAWAWLSRASNVDCLNVMEGIFFQEAMGSRLGRGPLRRK